MDIKLGDNSYDIAENESDSFNLEEVSNLYTDYFKDFDFILGDWSYGKLRLKGFCLRSNARFKVYNDYKKMDDYVKTSCPPGCKYFVLKKLKKQ